MHPRLPSLAPQNSRVASLAPQFTFFTLSFQAFLPPEGFKISDRESSLVLRTFHSPESRPILCHTPGQLLPQGTFSRFQRFTLSCFAIHLLLETPTLPFVILDPGHPTGQAVPTPGGNNKISDLESRLVLRTSHSTTIKFLLRTPGFPPPRE